MERYGLHSSSPRARDKRFCDDAFRQRITGARRAPEYQGPQYANYTNHYTNPPENRPRATAHGGERDLYFRLTYKEFSPTTHNN